MVSNVVLVSGGIQPSYSVIHIDIFTLFKILFPQRLLQNTEFEVYSKHMVFEHAHLTKDEKFTNSVLSEEVRRAQCFSLKREQIAPNYIMEHGEEGEIYCM